jgi:spore germination protein YaaH
MVFEIIKIDFMLSQLDNRWTESDHILYWQSMLVRPSSHIYAIYTRSSKVNSHELKI